MTTATQTAAQIAAAAKKAAGKKVTGKPGPETAPPAATAPTAAPFPTQTAPVVEQSVTIPPFLTQAQPTAPATVPPFAVQATATPEQQAETDEAARIVAEKRAAFEKRRQEREQREAERLAKAAKKGEKIEKAPKVIQNNIARPTSGDTLTIWDTADRLATEKQRPITVEELEEALLDQPIKTESIKSQHGRWKRFYGIKGRIKVPAVSADPVTTE